MTSPAGCLPFNVEGAAIAAGRIMLARHAQSWPETAWPLSPSKPRSPAAASPPWVKELNARRMPFHLVYLWLPSAGIRCRSRGQAAPGWADIRCLRETIRRRYHGGVRNFFSLRTGRLRQRGQWFDSSARVPVR